jgi:hypothetical protein
MIRKKISPESDLTLARGRVVLDHILDHQRNEREQAARSAAVEADANQDCSL